MKDGSTFVQALALGSTQFCGYVRSAKLPPLSPYLDPKPRTEVVMSTGEVEEAPVSMAAGWQAKGNASLLWFCLAFLPDFKHVERI